MNGRISEKNSNQRADGIIISIYRKDVLTPTDSKPFGDAWKKIWRPQTFLPDSIRCPEAGRTDLCAIVDGTGSHIDVVVRND